VTRRAAGFATGRPPSEGRALFEADELIFRGDFRLANPLRQIESVEATEGELAVRFDSDEAILELGLKAARWAERIRNPRTRLDKLGVKPDSVGSRIRAMDVLEAGRAAGLKDTKVARFSETHTAHRFTIPLEAR
jgi:hypothetical protein